ncbi:hypothetical protein KC365_g9 [Hortaea werneckii]|nr:hypothetical protein KC339_g9 [Hortaea werneckii]KAI7245842.1 hypothetical protein KC365_g9 [Hortaea werneckii]
MSLHGIAMAQMLNMLAMGPNVPAMSGNRVASIYHPSADSCLTSAPFSGLDGLRLRLRLRSRLCPLSRWELPPRKGRNSHFLTFMPE